MTTFASDTLALAPDFLTADTLAKAGVVVVMLIVFAESGLLVGFFLPGDSVLFTLGLLIARGDETTTPLWAACLLIAVAAIAGDQVGYLFGRKVGPALFRRPNSRLFKQENVEKAHDFFEKYGPRSIVLARFTPIVRTFTPIVAGVSRMNYRVFVTFNVIGGVLWGCGVTILGFYLGRFEVVRENIEAMIILIVLVSVSPIAFELLRTRSKAKAKKALGEDPGSGSGSGSGTGQAGSAASTPVVPATSTPATSSASATPSGGGRTGAGGKHSVAAVQRRSGESRR